MVMFDRNVSWAADIENGIFGKTTNPEFNKIVADNNLKIIKLFDIIYEMKDIILLKQLLLEYTDITTIIINNPRGMKEEWCKRISLFGYSAYCGWIEGVKELLQLGVHIDNDRSTVVLNC